MKDFNYKEEMFDRYNFNSAYDPEDFRSEEMLKEAGGEWVRYDDIEEFLPPAQNIVHEIINNYKG